MSENQSNDEKSERKRRKREKREQERIEKELKEQAQQRNQNEADNTQSAHSPDQPTTSGTKNRNKKRRVYYSAISGSEEDDPKFKDPTSSSDDFKEAISRTDNEAEPSKSKPVVAKPTKTPLQPIPELTKTYKDAQTETSKEMLQPNKEIKEKSDLSVEKVEEIPEAKPKKTMPKPLPKIEESSLSLQSKTQDDQDGYENMPEKFPKHEETPSTRRSRRQNSQDEQQLEKKRKASYDSVRRKPPSPKIVPAISPAEGVQLSEKQKSEREKFDELSSDHDNDDEDDYEVALEKLRRHMRQKTQNKLAAQVSQKSADTWSYGDTHTLNQGGAFVYMVIPPDGGYGWLILTISFLCQVIVDGIVLSLGIVQPFIAEDLGTSPSTTSLIGSTQIGPITSAFINKYGFRPVAMFGGIVAISTILISTLTTNLPTLILFYSVFGGMSLSMIWSSSQLIVGYYFEKYRPIASGISCSGAGAGVLIFSYMNSQLAPKVGWRNTSRIHTIFLACVLVLVIFYIEVEPTRIGRMVGYNFPDTDEDSDETGTGMHSYFYSKITLHDTVKQSKSMHGNLVFQYESIPVEEPSRLNKCFQFICPPFKRFMAERHHQPRSADAESRRVVIMQDPLDRQDIYYTGPAEYEDINELRINDIILDTDRDIEIEMLPANNRTTQSIHYNLAARHDSIVRQASVVSDDPSIRRKSNPYLEFISPKNWVHPKIKRAFNMLFDLRLLAVLEFQVLLASAFFFPMGFNIPFVYSKARSEIDLMYSDLISPAIGLSNFIFRIASGFIAFKFRPHTIAICGTGIIFGGSFTFLSSLFGEDLVWFQFLYAVCFGVAPAFYSTLRAIIYVQVLGLERLTNAFGLTAMAMGAGVFIGTFTGGILIEITGGYVATFAFSGSCMILAGCLKLFLPAIVAWKRLRAQNRKAQRRLKSAKK